MTHMHFRIVCLLALSACRLWSQALSGTIVGTVTDSAGAVVPGAKVTLTNEGTHFARTVDTNANGQYVASSVPTGSYAIAVQVQGFQKMVREGVDLTAADTVTVDFKLTVGDVQQTIEVKAEAPLLQSQTAAVTQLITNQQIVEMPLNGRTFTSLLLLAPGVHTGSAANLNSSPYGMRGSTNYSVNGSSAQMNSYLIDGMVNRNLWLSTLIMVPTIDSIQEFRVMTSNYSAEYGASAGAMTVVQTKSGSNEFHGSAYEFLRNDKLDANAFFNNRLGAPKPPFRRNEFGATAGGPIRKNKTFFFADYQGIRIRQPQTITSTIPTLAQRAMLASGDFSNLGAPIFDPTSTQPGANGATVRDQFPGNRIPADPPRSRRGQAVPTAAHSDVIGGHPQLHLQPRALAAHRSVRCPRRSESGRLGPLLLQVQLRRYGSDPARQSPLARQRRHPDQSVPVVRWHQFRHHRAAAQPVRHVELRQGDRSEPGERSARRRGALESAHPAARRRLRYRQRHRHPRHQYQR